MQIVVAGEKKKKKAAFCEIEAVICEVEITKKTLWLRPHLTFLASFFFFFRQCISQHLSNFGPRVMQEVWACWCELLSYLKQENAFLDQLEWKLDEIDNLQGGAEEPREVLDVSVQKIKKKKKNSFLCVHSLSWGHTEARVRVTVISGL